MCEMEPTTHIYNIPILTMELLTSFRNICIICFTEMELMHLDNADHVKNLYRNLTACDIGVYSIYESFPSHICSGCVIMLNEAASFREKCIKAYDFLTKLSIPPSTMYPNSAVMHFSTSKKNKSRHVHTSGSYMVNTPGSVVPVGKLYICKVCSDSFAGFQQFKMHRKSHKLIKCKECSMVFRHNKSYQRHNENVHSGPYVCSICTKEYRYKHLLTNHQRTKCLNPPPPCSVCKVQLPSKGRLAKHMYDIHSVGEKSVSSKVNETIDDGNDELGMCEICAEILPVKQLPKHILRRHRECRKCGRKFRTNAAQKEHDCNNPFPYKCQYCDSSFAFKQKLNMHLVIKHQTERPYHCHLCDKKFKLGYKLKAHIRTHTGEKPYQCTECNKRFRDQQYLRAHRYRIHTEPTPQNNFQPPVPRYACDYCSVRRFTRRAIQTHILSHTGELPYLCKLCNIGFKTAFSFHRHNKRYHSNVNSDNDLTVSNTSQKSSQPSRWNYRLLQCTLCHLNFFYMKNLEAHLIHCRDQHGLLNVGDIENYYITLKNGVNDLYEEEDEEEEEEEDGVIETEGVEEGDDVYVYVTDMENVNESEQAIANLYNYKEIHDIVEQ